MPVMTAGEADALHRRSVGHRVLALSGREVRVRRYRAVDRLLHDEAIARGLWTLEITNILIVHQDRGSVFTGYAWTGRLLGAGVRLSYALGGPKDNPEMESFFRRFKVENRSLLLGAES